MIALLKNRKQERRSPSFKIAGWAQLALFGWMICWGNHPLPRVHATKVEYVAVGTARIDCSQSSPEQREGRAERERVSQFLELVTTINGVRNWHVTGPDLDGRYGGLNGCGGVEAIYNQSTSSATYLLSDTYGHTEGTLSGTTFVWNPTQCDGYGALPGTTKPSALVAGANVASQLGWRGHYIDPTGFYYMGARNYAPDSGTFLSPDPLGHSASMDLYSYCDGDPVNQYDADGRFGKGAITGQDYNAASTAGAYAGLLNPLTALTQAASSLILQDTLLNQTTLAPLNKAITKMSTEYFTGESSVNGNRSSANSAPTFQNVNWTPDPNGSISSIPPSGNYLLNDAQVSGQVNYSINRWNNNYSSQGFVGAMVTQDTQFKTPQSDQFQYSGTQYPQLQGKTFTATELNYIGVGVGFAASNLTPLAAYGATAAWNIIKYNTPPSKNTYVGTQTGYNSYINK